MPRKITKADCSGCYSDFYNDHNPYGVKECWSFKNAEMVKKIDIPIDVPPPYKGRGYLPVLRRNTATVLTCWWLSSHGTSRT